MVIETHTHTMHESMDVDNDESVEIIEFKVEKIHVPKIVTNVTEMTVEHKITEITMP
jgi:hypothetical protein